jgi:hypothetical protein
VKDVLSNLTSPAKLAFAAYILLAYKGVIHAPWWMHLIVFVLFVAVQILHDDYWRIRLNHKADIAAAKDAQKAQITGKQLAEIRSRTAQEMGLRQ